MPIHLIAYFLVCVGSGSAAIGALVAFHTHKITDDILALPLGLITIGLSMLSIGCSVANIGPEVIQTRGMDFMLPTALALTLHYCGPRRLSAASLHLRLSKKKERVWIALIICSVVNWISPTSTVSEKLSIQLTFGIGGGVLWAILSLQLRSQKTLLLKK